MYFSLQLNEIVLHMMIVIITLHWTTMLSQSEALFLWPSLEPNQRPRASQEVDTQHQFHQGRRKVSLAA